MQNSSDPPVFSKRLLDVVPRLVKEAMRIREGQVVEVTLTGERRYLDILDEVTLAISRLGAYPVIRLNTPSYRRRFMQSVPEQYLMKPPPHMLKWISDINRHINLVADAPRFNPIHISEKRQQVHRDAQKSITGLIKQKNITTVYLPTVELAEYCGSTSVAIEDRVLNGLDIHYPDLRRSCRKMADSIKGKTKTVTLKTGDGFEMTCRIEDRQIFTEDGLHELPGGMVFFAPIETSVNGEVFIPYCSINQVRVTNLRLEFKSGKLVRSEADENHKAFCEKIRSSYGDCDVFAGIGIGMNPGIPDFAGYTLFDFYSMNTVHISLGSNLIYGGANFSDLFIRLATGKPVLQVNGDVAVASHQ